MVAPAQGPTALIILDGWGINQACPGNAVTCARTPYLDSLFEAYPHARLIPFGEAVGLPQGQMGNSEVGHLNLGAGRVVYQDITRIDRAMRHGELTRNEAIAQALEAAQKPGATLHLMGLLSDGGVHSLQSHLEALIDLALAKGVARVRVHAFLDGRDTPPDSGRGYVAKLQDFLADKPAARVATISGRYWAMDRDKRWERVAKAYDALVRGQGPTGTDPLAVVAAAHARQEWDEFVTPTVMVDEAGRPLGTLADGDAVIFYNFRADRARELTWALTQDGFDGFDVSGRPRLGAYVCMTRYHQDMGLPVAFPPVELTETLAQVISDRGLRQLHIAETEKYAHVTFFFNGGREEPFPGEDRVLVPSPKEVDTYDQKPAMSAPEVTDQLLARLDQGYDLIVLNYANCDMVGHTGDLQAAIAAVEVLDGCLARLVPAILAQGGRALITADHGNAEEMIDAHGGRHTAHTDDKPVPVILVDPARQGARLRDGSLCDVAPTLLALMGLDQPTPMTGASLLMKD